MTLHDAVRIAEGNIQWADTPLVEDYENDPEGLTLEAWQTLVNSGTAWQLQGWFGRRAAALIDAGLITGGRA